MIYIYFSTAPYWSNRGIAGSYIRSYEIKRPPTTKYFSFFWLLSTLSIMSTNRASLESGFPVRDAGALTRNAKGYSL